jgi:hypothetical protein
MDFFNHPLNMLGLGFALGCVLLVLSWWNHFKTKSEFRRYKMMLSDKLELETRQMQTLTKERDGVQKENENLRVQVAKLNDRGDNKIARDLEVYARAEKQMKINAPGFAGAWEMAKEAAHNQLAEEEKGTSLPQRLFRKLVGGGANQQALPAESVSKSGGNSENSSAA